MIYILAIFMVMGGLLIYLYGGFSSNGMVAKDTSVLCKFIFIIGLLIFIGGWCVLLYTMFYPPAPYYEHLSFEPYVIDGDFYIENGDGGFTALNLNNYDVCCGYSDKYIIEYDKITYKKGTSLERVDNGMHNIVVYYPKEIFENITK